MSEQPNTALGAEPASGPVPTVVEYPPAEAISFIRSALLAVVAKAEVGQPEGAKLTFVGGLFGREMKVPFEHFVNFHVLQSGAKIPTSKRKMLPFLREYCSDVIEIDEQPNGTVMVKTKAVPTTPIPRATHRPVYHKAVWLSFVRPLDSDKRRFIKLGDRVGFTDIPTTEKPDPSWKEVPRELILGIPADQPIDISAVHDRLDRWIATTDVEVDALTLKVRGMERPGSNLGRLLDIIEALPEDVVRDWQIPARVLIALREG